MPTTVTPVPSLIELDASERMLSHGMDGLEKVSRALKARADSKGSVDLAEIGRSFMYLEHIETVHELTGRTIREIRERTLGLAYADEGGGEPAFQLSRDDLEESKRLAAEWAANWNA